ncbi:Tyrosine-sulfated glycopeptide receptor 1 [Dichanthelium oligosanthes]|uniref:Tyrosine-sulfated glycopeptide receptor 1 n=1 Tax=Dichanthelium oligosanthes TaxID=888268 RepID=A0A1E5UVB8_9POAL|nr:Tyrosine-sulfated glycopeptide receptor 1 [Dichanthelium oligosanthes]
MKSQARAIDVKQGLSNSQLSNRVRNLKSLSFLSLTDNNFTNTLHILKSSRNLMVLLIGLNFRYEVMPQDGIMDGFENLQVLGIDKYSLSGSLPVWLSKLTNLKILFLSNNRLTGPIPSWINTLHSLFYIDIANNNLGGEIPAELMEMPMLQVHRIAYFGTEFFEIPIYVSSAYQYRMLSAFPQLLNLSSNNLAGVIPPDIGQLGGLVALDLSFNNLYGGIPQSIGNLTTLLVLDLSSNHLTGTIPPVLMHLHFLSKFNVSNNDLEGPIPNGGQFDTFPKSSFDGNPKLYVTTVTHYSGPAEAPPVSILLAKQVTDKIIFLVAFISFFIVGVLYDQVVLSTYLSYPYS